MRIPCPRYGLLNPDDAIRCDCGCVVGSAGGGGADESSRGGGSGKDWVWIGVGVCAVLIVLAEGFQPLVFWNLASLELAVAAGDPGAAPNAPAAGAPAPGTPTPGTGQMPLPIGAGERTSQDDGCGCRVPGTASGDARGLWSLPLAALLLGLRRKRRRRGAR